MQKILEWNKLWCVQNQTVLLGRKNIMKPWGLSTFTSKWNGPALMLFYKELITFISRVEMNCLKVKCYKKNRYEWQFLKLSTSIILGGSVPNESLENLAGTFGAADGEPWRHFKRQGRGQDQGRDRFWDEVISQLGSWTMLAHGRLRSPEWCSSQDRSQRSALAHVERLSKQFEHNNILVRKFPDLFFHDHRGPPPSEKNVHSLPHRPLFARR